MPVFNLERAATDQPITWRSIFGLILIPLLIAGGLVWATWNASDRMSTVQAAVVNNDEMAEVDGQSVPLGRQLAAGLVDSQPENFDWVLSDDEDAAGGLADGTYSAVVTIPKNFSASATSFGNEDPMKAAQATIEVETSQISPLSDGLIGQSIAQVATSTMNTALTETYLDNIYLGFNEVGTQLGTIADATNKLDEGATGIDTAMGETQTGASELAAGMDQLTVGGSELSAGAGDLAAGTGELATGTDELATGASELSTGLGTLADSTATLPEDTRTLADGAGELSAGVDEYTKGVDTIIAELGKATGDSSSGDAEGGLGELTEGVAALDESAQGLSTGIAAARDGLADQAEAPEQAVPAEALSGVCQEAELPAGSAECEAMQGVFLAGVSAGLTGGASALDTTDPDTGYSLVTGADALAEGSEALREGITVNLGDLLDGMDQLTEGTDELADAGAALRDGASQLSDGTDGLADGMGELSKGIGEAADGGAALADGAGQLADGVGALDDGTSQLATGVSEYTAGVDQAAVGTTGLAEGLALLADGTGELADGTGELAKGVEEGADQVPTYSPMERDNLGSVVAEPVAEQDISDSLFAESAAIALLIALALWIGALVTYLIVRAISARALGSSESSASLAWRSLVPGFAVAAIQAVLLAILAQAVLKLNVFDFAALLVFAVFAGIVFAAINHALVSWFGGAGRFISVILAVLSLAGQLLSAVPGFFTAVKPVLPMTPAFNGIAALTSGAPGLGAAYGALLIWLVLAVAASIIAVARKRVAGTALLAATARA